MRQRQGRKKGKCGPLIVTDQPMGWEEKLEIFRECVDTALKPSSKNACALVFLPVHVCGTCTPGSQRPQDFR